MRVKANKALIASILTGLVFLFGCGGGGSTSSTPSTPNQVAPTITSASSATFNEGSAGSFTVTATGTPTTTITESGALPPGVTFSAGILSGTPTASGSFPITITASNSVSPNAVQSFTLTVNASSSSSALTSNFSSLAFTGAAGGSNPTGQSITISSTTGSQLTVSAAATTTDGANWLLLNLPGNMTTPITLPVSADIIDTGMGASTFTGTITLTAAGSSAPPLVVNVSLSLAPSQPPYFTGSYPYSLLPQGPASVTMPDGTVVTQGSNQLLVFVSQGATPAQMTGIGSVLNSAGASAVGEIQYGNILEVQVPNVGVVPALMSKLLVTPGVVDVEPYIFTQRGQASCLNTQPGSWLTADNLPSAAPPSNGVAILVADCFNASLCPEGLTNSTTGLPISHGDAVARFLKGDHPGKFYDHDV